MIDNPPPSIILNLRLGGTGAAEPCEPRQVREEAAVRRFLRVLPVILPGALQMMDQNTNTTTPPVCSYEGSDYQDSFWETGTRRYEDAVEAVALQRLLNKPGI